MSMNYCERYPNFSLRFFAKQSTTLPRFPHTPRWWWRFFRHAIHRMKLQQTHCLFNGALELRIVSRDDIFGPILDIDIRRNAFVLDRPFAIMTEEAAAGSDRRSAVDKDRRVGRVHEAAPGSFADQRAE